MIMVKCSDYCDGNGLCIKNTRADLSQPSVGIDELSAIIFSRTQAPMDCVYSAAEAILSKYNVTVKG